MSDISADEARRLIEEAKYWWAQTGYSGSAVDRLIAAAPSLAAEVERLSAEREELRGALAEVLPYVDFDARYWNEDASEAQNRRRITEAESCAERLRTLLSDERDKT